ncbi:MAG: MerR family transcriptional [Beijerinckiaceae bacterium]|nr:MAG: MerR family transcriptional [Beijerinckiaceae bacterium]
MSMTIGFVAEKTCCSVATIRYYEEKGLLGRIGRAANGRRAYGWPDIGRLRLIRRLRDLGFGIDAVRTLIEAMHSPDSAACLDVRDLALSHIDVIRAKRAELDALEAILTDLAASCSDACRNGHSPDCTIIEAIRA